MEQNKKTNKQTGKSKAGDKKEIVRTIEHKISTRGRIFKGIVTRKFPKRVAIEFERTVKLPKFERFMKKKTRIHARLPNEMADSIHLGDLIKVQECRPLSKIIHFVVTEKIRSKEENKGNK